MKSERDNLLFESFDPDGDIEFTARNLPHRFQVGAAMFVTIRTADSLPKAVIQRWQEELKDWLQLNQLPIELANADAGQNRAEIFGGLEQAEPVKMRQFKKLSDQLFNRSLDECHGTCLLRQPELAQIVAEAILFFNGNRYDVDRFIVMPNHVHILVQFRSGETLGVVSQSWMRFSARRINSIAGRRGAFWQPEPFDHLVRSAEQFDYLQNYIVTNPKKANLREKEFLYWQR